MFVAIYRWRLHPDLEHDFIANWRRVTLRGHAAGSGGSRLFKDTQDCWVAIARCTSRDARDRFFQSMEGDDAEPGRRVSAARAIIERVPVQEMESMLDGWAAFPETNVASSA